MKRLLSLALVIMLCLSGCGFFSGNPNSAPSGTYTDEKETVFFVFEENRLTLENQEGAFAAGTFVMSGTQVQITFEGDFSDYLNSLGNLTYNVAADTLTDAAGAVLYKVQSDTQ